MNRKLSPSQVEQPTPNKLIQQDQAEEFVITNVTFESTAFTFNAFINNFITKT